MIPMCIQGSLCSQTTGLDYVKVPFGSKILTTRSIASATIRTLPDLMSTAPNTPHPSPLTTHTTVWFELKCHLPREAIPDPS